MPRVHWIEKDGRNYDVPLPRDIERHPTCYVWAQEVWFEMMGNLTMIAQRSARPRSVHDYSRLRHVTYAAGSGFWIWEGYLTCLAGQLPLGEWRRPTDEETARLAQGKLPSPHLPAMRPPTSFKLPPGEDY